MAITLSETAAQRVRDHLTQHQAATGLRLGVTTTGCSGYAYVVEYADTINNDDRVFESNGVKIIVDADSLGYIDGTEIDFQENNLGSAFKFNNPNVTAECGCGESFTTDTQ